VFAPRRDDWGNREQLAPSPAARFPG
jgi:hypothetical protein